MNTQINNKVLQICKYQSILKRTIYNKKIFDRNISIDELQFGPIG